jgi:hypothetical protein
MGLQDRDYMRRQRPVAVSSLGSPRGFVPRSRRKFIGAVVILLVLGSSVSWFYPKIIGLIADLRATEGSLIVNINTASRRELETVPGVGPGLATLIIAHRPHGSVEDLVRLPGIGPRNLEGFRPFLCTDCETARR